MTACLSKEMLAGHCWSDSERYKVGDEDIFGDTGEVPVEAQIKLR